MLWPLLRLFAFLSTGDGEICCLAFEPSFGRRPRYHHFSVQRSVASFPPLRSSLGNGPPPSDDDSKKKWDELFDPRDESENMMKAREYLNENSLPISFGAADDDPANESTHPTSKDAEEQDDTESSALVSSVTDLTGGGLTPESIANNPYIDVVSQLAPSDLIAKFSSTAHPRVQNAVRNTILGLIGGLPKMAFDTTAVTTGRKLASLMFQLQMTGYMFKVCMYGFVSVLSILISVIYITLRKPPFETTATILYC